jgi:hypothetical protein
MARTPTYTVEITIHSAHNLPIADLKSLSCDAYVQATFITPSLPPYKPPGSGQDVEPDPPLTFRTPTVRNSRQAEWCPASSGPHSAKCEEARSGQSSGTSCLASGKWVVGGVPKEGFVVRMNLYDEDHANHDDRLGRAVADFTSVPLYDGFEVKAQEYEVKKRGGSIRGTRAIVQTYLVAMLPHVKAQGHAHIVLSMKVLNRTEDQFHGKVFTLGPSSYMTFFEDASILTALFRQMVTTLLASHRCLAACSSCSAQFL